MKENSISGERIRVTPKTGKSIILYLGAANALILPKKDIGNQLADLKALIREALPQQAKKLKK